MAKVQITLDKNGFGKVLVDGVEVPNVTKTSFACEAGSPPVVRLELLVDDLEINADVVVRCAVWVDDDDV